MEVITIESQAFLEIINRLDKLAELKVQNIESENFIDNKEFIELMKISKRTAQAWRDEGIISFSQIGSKIYYSMKDYFGRFQL